MGIVPRLSAAIAMVGASLLTLPTLGLAQPAPPPNAADQASFSQAQFDQIVRDLKAGIEAGDVNRVASTLSSSVIKAPQVTRLLAQIMGEAMSIKGPDFITAVTTQASANMAGGMSQAQGNTAIQQFAGGMASGLIKGNPGQASQLVTLATAATIVGGSQSEGKLGEMARIVSAGVVEALVNTQSTIPMANIATLIREGVSQGASRIVGADVRVDVSSTDDKPVSDVVLTKANGQVLDKGRDVVFTSVPTTVAAVTPTPTSTPTPTTEETKKETTPASPY